MAVILLSVLSQAMKKKREQNKPERESDIPEESGRPMTFEELLREIQEAKTSKTVAPPQATVVPPRYEPTPVIPAEPYDASPLERVPASDWDNDDTIYETYERAKKEAFTRQSLEESMKLSDTVVEPVRFKGYSRVEEWTPASRYAVMLKDPEAFKQAFVLAEILMARKF